LRAKKKTKNQEPTELIDIRVGVGLPTGDFIFGFKKGLLRRAFLRLSDR
jgi:hypothetical protein